MIGAIAVALALSGVTAPVTGQTTHASAAVAREGWWADSPSPIPPVPADGLGVAAIIGEPDKVAAMAIDLDVEANATLERLALNLTEAPEPQAQANARVAKVIACPATRAWTAVRGGPWEAAPTWNCTLASAEGFRSATGVWSFDLTTMGRLWEGSLPNHGVVLLENVGAPYTFQLSYLGLTTKTPTVEIATSGDEQEATPAPQEAPTTFDEGSGESQTADNSFAEIPALPDEPTLEAPRGDGTLAPPAPATADAPLAAQPAASGRRQGRLAGNWSPSAVLAIPLALLAAYGVARVLGPDGDPAAVRRRIGGVSRALDRRSLEDPR